MLGCWLTLLPKTELTPANRAHCNGIAVHPKAAPGRTHGAPPPPSRHSAACQLHVLVAAAPAVPHGSTPRVGASCSTTLGRTADLEKRKEKLAVML